MSDIFIFRLSDTLGRLYLQRAECSKQLILSQKKKYLLCLTTKSYLFRSFFHRNIWDMYTNISCHSQSLRMFPNYGKEQMHTDLECIIISVCEFNSGEN